MSDFRTPAGWMLVPIKPTQKMVNAAKEIDGRLSVWKWADGYVEMLKQAPKPPADLLPDAGKMVDSEQELRAQHELIQKLKAALEECVEDSEAAIVDHIQKYGQQYKAQRVVAMRKQVSDARAALAAAEAHK